jgi:YHS domain
MNPTNESRHHDGRSHKTEVAVLVKDPVCGMDVDPEKAARSFGHGGETYYFCSEACIGVPVAAGVLYPAFGLLLSPMIASLAITLSSVSVIMNALRLRNAAL